MIDLVEAWNLGGINTLIDYAYLFSSYRMYRGLIQLADKHKGNTSMLYPYLYVVFVVISSTQGFCGF